MDSFEWNKLSGWVLAAAIAVLGLSILSAKVFEPVQPKVKGYKVEGVEEVATTGAAAAEAEKPIAFYLASADPAKGEEQFKKCASCHNAAQGGPNGIGPNLYGVVGRPVGKHPGYAYSEAVAGHGGNWDWDNLSDWLKHPKVHIPGNKMSFAGIANPQDRANLIAWLNTQGSNLPKPPPPAETAAAEQPGAPPATTAADTPAPQPGKAPDTVVLDEKKAVAGEGKNIGGPGAPEVTGTSARERAKK